MSPSRRLHLVVYGAVFTLAMLAIPALSIVGVQALLDSRDGEVIDPILDPTEPGYQALVSPSPTLAVVHTDQSGTLVGVALLALSGDDPASVGGSVLVLPPSTRVSVPDLGDLTLEYVQNLNGAESTHSLMEWVLGIGIDDVVEVADDTWTEIVEPLGGLSLTNPDTVVSADGTVTFPAGELTLAPAEVGLYLAALDESENAFNRVLRQELVWKSLLSELAEGGDGVAFAGEQDRGLARFMPTIAAGTRRVETLPVIPGPDPATVGGAELFDPDDDLIAELVPVIVPFPSGARPGDRPLVRVLDGSARGDLLPDAVRHIAIAGGQVVMIGNADEFGVAETTIRYADPAVESFVQSVVEELGVGNVELVDHIDDNAELIIVLGSDYSG